ncbi:MAG: hypothetical protein N2C14_19630, partial [Planctomycetales bacterium]
SRTFVVVAFRLFACALNQVDAGVTSRSGSQYPTGGFPETQALKRDLELASQSLASTAARLKRLQHAARNARKEAEDVSNMIRQIKSIESQLGRMERQLASFANIPQLKMLKPLVSALRSVKSQVYSARVKADRFRREAIDPAVKKIKSFEAEVSQVASRIRQAELETDRAKLQLAQVSAEVTRLGNKEHAVRSLESLARATRSTIRPLRVFLTDVDNAGADAERKINTYASGLSAVTRLKPGLSKLQADLSPIDKKARDLDRTLSKRLSFKIPFTKKTVSFTVRQVIESPGKILKIALKPLTAISKKILRPFAGKFKINLKAPPQIAQLSKQFDSLRGRALNMDAAHRKLNAAARSQAATAYRSALNRLIVMTVGRLSS